MKTYYLIFLLIFFSISYSQIRNNDSKYYSKCKASNSTGAKTSKKELQWSLSKNDILNIIKLSKEIEFTDVHNYYSTSPCNIKVDELILNNKSFEVELNGGSYFYLTNKKVVKIYGCEKPECKKYFLTSIEEVASDNDNSNQYKKVKSIVLDFNNDKINDKIIISKNVDKDIEEFKLTFFNNNELILSKKIEFSNVYITTKSESNEEFILNMEIKDRGEKIFKIIKMPTYFLNKKLYVKNIFIKSKFNSAKTGKEEWLSKEIKINKNLKDINIENLVD